MARWAKSHCAFVGSELTHEPSGCGCAHFQGWAALQNE